MPSGPGCFFLEREHNSFHLKTLVLSKAVQCSVEKSDFITNLFLCNMPLRKFLKWSRENTLF